MTDETHDLPKNEPHDLPTNGMKKYQSIKKVLAGEITEVVPAGCYVKEADGSGVLRLFPPKMTERYQPKIGDFWVVYEDGYQAISPREPFLSGYVDDTGDETDR